jgi:hypothetical protein
MAHILHTGAHTIVCADTSRSSLVLHSWPLWREGWHLKVSPTLPLCQGSPELTWREAKHKLGLEVTFLALQVII